MFIRMRTLLMLGFLSCIAYGGWRGYLYFFDPTAPKITVSGVSKGGHYSNDMQCTVASNKPGELAVWLDDQVLIEPKTFVVSRAGIPDSFIIPTRTLSNGEHTLKMAFTDKTFKGNVVDEKYTFYVDNTPLKAAFVQSDLNFKVFQGRTLHVQFQVNKDINSAKVHALSREYPCFPESDKSRIYECFVPIMCEETPNEYLVSAEIVDRVGNTTTLDSKFQVVNYPFKKQALQIKKEKIKEEKALGRPIAEREQELEKLALQSPQEKLWHGVFCTPIDITHVSCEFGTIRTTQEKGRYMHKALDVYNMPKSVVWAPQSGIVVLKDRFEDSGKTVVVDHGWGLLSLFYHLDDFSDIEVGQKIAQGNPVGTLGKTGYATGYHLHWEQRLNNVPIDPMQWTKPTF